MTMVQLIPTHVPTEAILAALERGVGLLADGRVIMALGFLCVLFVLSRPESREEIEEEEKTLKTTIEPQVFDGKVVELHIKNLGRSFNHIIAQTEASRGKNPAAVALGRLGGLKGGKARAEKLTDEQRRKSAMKAAKARWAAKKT